MKSTDPLDREREAQRIVNAYRRLFGTKAGRMILDDIKQRFATDLPAFLPCKEGGYDPIYAAIRDGQRSVMIHIEHQISLPFVGDGNIEKPQTTVIKP